MASEDSAPPLAEEATTEETTPPVVDDVITQASPKDEREHQQRTHTSAVVRLQALWRGFSVFRDAKRAREVGLAKAHVVGMRVVESEAAEEGLKLTPPIVSILGYQRAKDVGLLTERVAAMWWGYSVRRGLKAARSLGVETTFAQELIIKLREAPHVMVPTVCTDGGCGVRELRNTNGRDAAAACRSVLLETIRRLAAEDYESRERARAARDAMASALCEELLEEVVLVEVLRTVHHAHDAVGRAGFKDAMEWLDPKARDRKLFKPTGSNGDWLLEEARRAAAVPGSASTNEQSAEIVGPSRSLSCVNSIVFAELPNWSGQDRHRTMRGGGFVQIEEKEKEGSGGLGTRPTLKGDDKRALIEVPFQPLADAEPWWKHLDKLSGGGPEAEEAHRLRTEIGRPRRDSRGGTPDSLDTPPESPPKSPSPVRLEAMVSQVEAQMNSVATTNPPPTFLTSTNDMMLDPEEGSMTSLPMGSPTSTSREMTQTTNVSPRRTYAAPLPRPQTSFPSSSGRTTMTRYEKYMRGVLDRDKTRDDIRNDYSTPQTPASGVDTGLVSTGTASVMFTSSRGSSTLPRNVINTQRRGWCDRPRLLSSHRRVRERQVTVVTAETPKPCTGWGWGSRAPTEHVMASLCSLPILGAKSAKALQTAAVENGNKEGKIRPATAHVFTTGGGASNYASTQRTSVASYSSRYGTTTQVGQAWKTPPMHTVRVLESGRTYVSTARARMMHSRGGVRGEGREVFPQASSKDESLYSREIVGEFFMDGHPSGW